MKEMSTVLIAPCGMNCRLCMAYQRDKKQCKGCHWKRGFGCPEAH